jgi:hypothetical protein
MTHHDLLIDSIMSILYDFHKDGESGELWNYATAEQSAQEILVLVEEFQEKRAKLGKKKSYLHWRASD